MVKTGREVDTNTREAFGLEMWYARYIVCSLSSFLKNRLWTFGDYAVS